MKVEEHNRRRREEQEEEVVRVVRGYFSGVAKIYAVQTFMVSIPISIDEDDEAVMEYVKRQLENMLYDVTYEIDSIEEVELDEFKILE